jgi:uncharacterized membrane protein SpoIIM required for sporulation
MRKWMHDILVATPRRLYRDNYIRLAFVIFWGLFIASMILARNSDAFSTQLLTAGEKEHAREMFEKPISGRDFSANSFMAGYYVYNNTSIGIQVFSWGVFFGIGGIYKLAFEGARIGATFGFMSTIDGPTRTHFFTFVTAHGPFELTAIVLSAAAGMRMGFSLISTGTRSRADALAVGARESFPTICVAIVLFVFAAFIEGFISPSALPFGFKATISALSSGLLLYYFVVLGHPEIEEHAGSE